MPMYPPAPGLIRPGNIDLAARSLLHVPNPEVGGYSSIYSTSFRLPRGYPNAGRQVLIPRVVHTGGRWQIVSPLQAWHYFQATGKNLGVFKSIAAANRYSDLLHVLQARGYRR
jgi:hypothetical protein